MSACPRWMNQTLQGDLRTYTGYSWSIDGPTTTQIFDEGWVGMSPSLLEHKTVQVAGYLTSPSIAVNRSSIIDTSVTRDFVLHTTLGYICAGVILQLS
ncbi:hypothetical protein BGZ74_005321 [Mortierella antarctica]|nr:hypothetical protein BGZ74_005321 [Mortierella antarctica]